MATAFMIGFASGILITLLIVIIGIYCDETINKVVETVIVFSGLFLVGIAVYFAEFVSWRNKD